MNPSSFETETGMEKDMHLSENLNFAIENMRLTYESKNRLSRSFTGSVPSK